jgi:hypothetical protein
MIEEKCGFENRTGFYFNSSSKNIEAGCQWLMPVNPRFLEG